MKNFAYYSYPVTGPFTLNRCSVASDDAPLIVNCAGSYCSAVPFTTDNPAGRDDWYLLFVLTGQLLVPLNDGMHVAHPGDAILYPPHCPYRYHSDGGGTLQYLWVHFTGASAAQYLGELGFGESPGIWRTAGENRCAAWFAAIFDCYAREEPLRRQALGADLAQLLLALARAVRAGAAAGPLSRSLRVIHSSYTEPLRIPALAALEHLSHSRYSALFRSQTGLSPRQYVTLLRMRHACELLLGTDMPVKEIGALVGYADPHFFSKLFRQHCGVPPLEYRRRAEKKLPGP